MSTLSPTLTRPQSVVEQEPLTLADYIVRSITAVSSWNSSSFYLPQSILFGQANFSTADAILQHLIASNSTFGLILFKRVSEVLGFVPDMDQALRDALLRSPLDAYSLPRTYEDAFNIWDFYLLHGFRYAVQYNLSNIWNTSSAYQGLTACRNVNGRAFWQCIAEYSWAPSMFGTRWMNTANLAKAFMLLYNVTQDYRMLDSALREWNYFNDNYWNENWGAYEYSRNVRTWEWSALEVFFNYYQLLLINGSLSHWDRVNSDLEHRYLAEKWKSPLWNSGMIVHDRYSSQRRVKGTLDAWQLLHAFITRLAPSSRATMLTMIEGNTTDSPAWQKVVDPASGVYNGTTFKFRIDSDKDYSDGGTIEATTLLFLLGIAPLLGGLQIHMDSEGYSGGFFQERDFRFLYCQRKIVVPVRDGTSLKFLFGSKPVTFDFGQKGRYLIQFDDNWNSIISVSRITRDDMLKLPLEPLYNLSHPESGNSEPGFSKSMICPVIAETKIQNTSPFFLNPFLHVKIVVIAAVTVITLVIWTRRKET